MRRSESGHSVVEIVAAAAATATIAMAALSSLASGTTAARATVADETANAMAGRTLERIAREIADAPVSTIVFAPSTPHSISFRRVVGYDEFALTAAQRSVLSPTITYRAVAVAAAEGPYAVQRSESGRSPVRVASFLAAEAGAPALAFDVRTFGSRTVVEIVLTISLPDGRGGERRARRATAVEVPIE